MTRHRHILMCVDDKDKTVRHMHEHKKSGLEAPLGSSLSVWGNVRTELRGDVFMKKVPETTVTRTMGKHDYRYKDSH